MFLLCLLVLRKYKSESGTFVTGTISLTVGTYAPECIKEVGDTVSFVVLVFMNNFHSSAENKLSQREAGREQQEKGEAGSFCKWGALTTFQPFVVFSYSIFYLKLDTSRR